MTLLYEGTSYVFLHLERPFSIRRIHSFPRKWPQQAASIPQLLALEFVAAGYTIDGVEDPAPALASTTSVPVFWILADSASASSSVNGALGRTLDSSRRMVVPEWPPTTGTSRRRRPPTAQSVVHHRLHKLLHDAGVDAEQVLPHHAGLPGHTSARG